jgi:hypothetical protein
MKIVVCITSRREGKQSFSVCSKVPCSLTCLKGKERDWLYFAPAYTLQGTTITGLFTTETLGESAIDNEAEGCAFLIMERERRERKKEISRRLTPYFRV